MSHVDVSEPCTAILETYDFSIELLQLRIFFVGPAKAVIGHGLTALGNSRS